MSGIGWSEVVIVMVALVIVAVVKLRGRAG
jgi:hypothetical protein